MTAAINMRVCACITRPLRAGCTAGVYVHVNLYLCTGCKLSSQLALPGAHSCLKGCWGLGLAGWRASTAGRCIAMIKLSLSAESQRG